MAQNETLLTNKISRRQALKVAGGTAAVAVLAACGGAAKPTPEPGAPPAAKEVTVTFWGQGSKAVDSARARLGAARWYRRQWKRALNRLRALLEEEQPIEPLRVAGTSRI